MRRDGETASGTAIRLAPALDDSYLPIQGPPGTGKTFTAARQILELACRGRTVGITGPSHAVICNLIDALCAHADSRGTPLRIGQRADKDNPYLHPAATRMTYDKLARPADRDLDVAAGTTWMWARDQFTGSVNTLFVDEAGQMSLANVLAVAGAGRSLVLLGDPQQLAQPSHAAHPRVRASRRWNTSWVGTRQCPPEQGCCWTRHGECTRSCASSPPRSSTTGN